MTSRDVTPDATPYLEAGRNHLLQGEVHAAVQVALRGLAEQPEATGLLLLLGEAGVAAEEWSAAALALEKAAWYVPLPAASRLALAQAWLHLGRTAAARTELQFLTEAERTPALLLPLLGHTLFQARLFRRATRVWNWLRRDFPDQAEPHYRYALCLHEIGADPERLFEPLQEAAMLRPNVPVYRIRLAEAWGDLGLYLEAAAELTELEPEEIRCSGCLRRGARLLTAAGRRNEAAHWRRRAAVLRKLKRLEGDST